MIDRRLNHVVAVADTGSFTKAAERMSITQSAITRSIADLERELGYALFYRSARGATCTELGREFAERAGQLIEDAKALLQSGAEGRDPFARTIRIGVCPSSSEWRLADPLATLIARHPKLRFEVLASSQEKLVQLLRSGGVDVAVGYEDAFVEWSDIKREHIGEVRGVYFVRKDHPLLAMGAVSVTDLAAFSCILPADIPLFIRFLRELYEAGGVPWQHRLHIIDNLAVMMRVVASSDAFALTSEEMTRLPGFAGTFAVVPDVSPFQPLSLCCATRARWELSPAVTAFLKVMREVKPQRYDVVA